MFKVPTIETERLILKALEMSDIPSYKKYFVDYDIIAHLNASVPWPYPEDGVKEYVSQFILPAQGTSRWDWGIFLKTNPSELIGSIAFFNQPGLENRGFWLGKEFWNKGLMSEAANAVMDYAFDSIGFEKLKFSNALGNDKSRRIKEKTGARLVSVEPGKFVDPNYKESEKWELTKEEWKNRNQK